MNMTLSKASDDINIAASSTPCKTVVNGYNIIINANVYLSQSFAEGKAGA